MNPLALAGAVGTAGAALLGFGIFHPRVPLFGPVIWRGPKTRPRIALTFDDGPHPEFTPRVLDLLAQTKTRATFFAVGQHAQRHPELVRRALADGHAVENHTFSHNTAAHLFRRSLLREDLSRAQDLLRSLGANPHYYRPAVGVRNPAVHGAARDESLTVVTWSQAPRDGAIPLTLARAEKLAQRCTNGSIIALHDGLFSTRRALREATLQNLPTLVSALHRRGFELVTLGELLGTP